MTLQTNGKLVAPLGPNEAGKSSLLAAIAHLSNERIINPPEISRNFSAEKVRIEGHFFLDANDLSAAGLSKPSWLTIEKDHSGGRVFEISPQPPGRGISHRALFDSATAALLDDLSAPIRT